jgi:hypothetical protein
MKLKRQCTVERLVGKIDNDFNISESDWIPRVAAWVIDALSQMKCLPMERKKRKLKVNNRIAIFPCTLNTTDIKVYDSHGCEIPELNSEECGCYASSSSTGGRDEIAVIDNTNNTGVNFMQVATINSIAGKNFVLDGDRIELNFDTDYITVESYEVATYHDDYYNCDCPYIYDDGILLEALSFYVLFKYLSRGSKHPVYELKSNSPVTNPWLQWNTLKTKATASVRYKLLNDDGWNNFFYNSTFLPRG